MSGGGDSDAGLGKLADALKALPKQAEAKTQAASAKAAQQILARAKASCPVKTGALRDSLTVVPDGQGAFLVTSPLPYAAGVEERDEVHHDQGHAHFLREAANEVLADVTEQFETAIEETLEVIEVLVSL